MQPVLCLFLSFSLFPVSFRSFFRAAFTSLCAGFLLPGRFSPAVDPSRIYFSVRELRAKLSRHAGFKYGQPKMRACTGMCACRRRNYKMQKGGREYYFCIDFWRGAPLRLSHRMHTCTYSQLPPPAFTQQTVFQGKQTARNCASRERTRNLIFFSTITNRWDFIPATRRVR